MVVVPNLLSRTQIDFLLNLCNNFKPDTNPSDPNNYYFRQYIQEEKELNILNSFLEVSKEQFSKNYFTETIEQQGIWLNRVDNTSNQSDQMHRDKFRFSSVTFLNSNFKGGEFNYFCPMTNRLKTITPREYDTIIFEGNAIEHKVNPVTEGTRYTLIVFWDSPYKETKTII